MPGVQLGGLNVGRGASILGAGRCCARRPPSKRLPIDPMPLPRLLLRLRARLRSPRRFVLLGLLGMLMVAMPFGEVLRRQAGELERLLAARAALDPLGDTVAVQRALLTHRVTAALLLGGHRDAEAACAARRHDVDRSLTTLTATLERGRYAAAAAENDTLREDWQALAEGVARQRLAVPASEQAHDLLVEQTLHIGDLLVLERGLHGAAERAGASLAGWAAARRAVLARAPARAPGPAGAAAEGVAAQGPAPEGPAPEGPASGALAAVQRQEAELATLRAQLAAASRDLERSQLAWQAALAAVGVLALLLALAAWPVGTPSGGRRSRGGTPPPSDPGPESRAPTEALLQRLRNAENRDNDPSPRAKQR